MYLLFNWPLLHKGWGNDKDQVVYITTFKTQWKLKRTNVIFHVYITHTWTYIWNWLSIVVASFALKNTNLPSPNMPHQTNVSWDYYEHSIAQTIYAQLYILSWRNHDWANEKSTQIGLVFSSFQFKLHHNDLLQHYF